MSLVDRMWRKTGDRPSSTLRMPRSTTEINKHPADSLSFVKPCVQGCVSMMEDNIGFSTIFWDADYFTSHIDNLFGTLKRIVQLHVIVLLAFAVHVYQRGRVYTPKLLCLTSYIPFQSANPRYIRIITSSKPFYQFINLIDLVGLVKRILDLDLLIIQAE
jgi:hypothetical protein